MLYEIFRSLISTRGAGGLFDFGATLPLLSVQFLVLIFVLNIILYNPILSTISERNRYIIDNLAEAATLITQTNEIKKGYENEILEARKAAQLEITQCQKSFKSQFDIEISKIQKEFDSVLELLTSRLNGEKEKVLTLLESEIESISDQILTKIFL